MSSDVFRPAEKYVAVLSSTGPQSRFASIRITKKGSAPAQSVKKIILTRLGSSPEVSKLSHFRADTYACHIGAVETKFRFAVTAARDQLPWFNLTFDELDLLSSTCTVLMVGWNSSRADSWCQAVRVFCLPTGQIAEQMQAVRPDTHTLVAWYVFATRNRLAAVRSQQHKCRAIVIPGFGDPLRGEQFNSSVSDRPFRVSRPQTAREFG